MSRGNQLRHQSRNQSRHQNGNCMNCDSFLGMKLKLQATSAWHRVAGRNCTHNANTHTHNNHLLHTDSPFATPYALPLYRSLPPAKCVFGQTNHLVKLSEDLPAALSTRAMHTLYIPAQLSIYLAVYITLPQTRCKCVKLQSTFN